MASKSCLLIADDSEADREIVKRVLEDSKVLCEYREVEDGAELLKYLKREPPFDDAKQYPFPDLLLLDINMPKVNGKDALKQIRSFEKGRCLPVVMLTTSQRDKDIADSYELGVNAFITKPVELIAFMDVVKQLETFWFQLVKLPPRRDNY